MRDVKCKWYWGPSRMGKSWKAIKDFGYEPSMDEHCDVSGLYFKNSGNKWWDGYFE